LDVSIKHLSIEIGQVKVWKDLPLRQLTWEILYYFQVGLL